MSAASPSAAVPAPARGTRAVRFLVTLAFALGLLLVGRGLLDGLQFIGHPFLNFGCTQHLYVNPVLFAAPDVGAQDVEVWDRIRAFNGTPLTDVEHFKRLLNERVPGDLVTLSLLTPAGALKDVTITVARFSVPDFFRWHTNQTLLALIIIIIGAWVWLLRSGGLALTFCLCCLATALMLLGGVDGTLFHRFPSLFHLSAPLVPASGMAFAQRLSPRLARHRLGYLAWLIPLLTGLVLMVLLLVFDAGPVQLTSASGVAVYALLVIVAGVFFVVMLQAWRRPEGSLDAARAGVVVLAWPLALGIPAFNFLLGFLSRSYTLTAIPNVAVLLMPASVAYAIFRQNLFEADVRLRRLFAELLITGFATAAYATVLGLTYRFYPDAAQSPAVAVSLAATFMFFAQPVRDRVKSRVDQLLEGRRYDAQEALTALSAALSAELSLDRALSRLSETLRDTVRPTNAGILLLRDDGEPEVTTMLGAPLPPPPAHNWRDAALVLQRAAATNLPRPEEDEDAHLAGVRFSDLPPGVELVVPLRAGGQLLGALLLGPSFAPAPRYRAADLLFVRTVAGQVAPALANARAFAEVDRLNRTLEERVNSRTAELTRVNEELRALDRHKDELISTISHDFRSPLSIIRSHVDTMLTDAAMDPATRTSFLHVVEKQARRLSSMAENLLDLARIHDRGVQQRALAVADLLRAAADGARPRLDQAQVSFDVELPPQPLSITADPDRLGQALYNLLDNAARFTPPRGSVRLYARPRGNVVTLGVSDTGIGIPPEDQARVCEPFYQVRRAGAEREGSGLGLAIVKEIVGRHGASLRLQSSPSGTTWEFDLPLRLGA